MKRKWIFLLVFICLITLGSLPSVSFVSAESTVDSGYTITDYQVDMVVSLDNSMLITEQLTVSFGSYALYGASHGIYRYIPTTLTVTRDLNGVYQDYTYAAQVDLLQAYIVQNNVSYEDASYENDNLVILLREDGLVNGLTRNYTIQYRYAIGNDRLADSDELYFNLLGDSWDTQVEHFSFSIEMPTAFDGEPVFYTGAFGTQTPSEIVSYLVSGNTITGQVTQPLGAYSAVTIRLVLPADYFSQVQSYHIAGDYAVLGLTLAALVAVLLLFIKWYKPKSIIPTVEFYPPDGLDPVGVAYFAKGYVTVKQMTSLIVYFASKNYLTIVDHDGDISLKKEKELPADANHYEKIIFNALFSPTTKGFNTVLEQALSGVDKDKQTLVDGVEIPLKKLEKSAGQSFTEASRVVATEHGARLNQKSIGQHVALLAMSLVGVVAFAALYGIRLGMFYGGGALFAGLLFLAGAYFCSSVAFGIIFYTESSVKKTIFTVLSLLFLGLVGLVMITTFWESFVDPLYLRIWVLLPVVLAIFVAPRLILFNDSTRIVFGKILGFKKNMVLVEKKRMEMLLKDNPSYFYDILPYAYVLNITNQFMKNFEGLALTPPTWYVSNRVGLFDIWLFTGVLNASLNQFSRNMISRNVSSGMGGMSSHGGFGGGFSGGGFGGGGGGRA